MKQSNPSSFTVSAALLIAALAAFAPFAPAQNPAQVPAQTSAPVNQAQYGNAQTLCTPSVIGNRRIPKERVLASLFSRQGDLYDTGDRGA